MTVLPQCTVSRHLPVLRHAVLVRDAPSDVTGRLPHALLDALAVTEPLAGERDHELQDPEGGPA